MMLANTSCFKLSNNVGIRWKHERMGNRDLHESESERRSTAGEAIDCFATQTPLCLARLGKICLSGSRAGYD